MDKIDLEELQELLAEEKESKTDWIGMFRKLYAKRKLFIISFVLTIIIVFPLASTKPRNYRVQVKLAPEFASMGNNNNSLTSLMRSFGVGTGNSNNSGDAILPTLYPDLMNSKLFLVSLFDVPVVSKKGGIHTTYYKYLTTYQKTSAIDKIIGFVFSLIPRGGEDENAVNTPVNNNKAVDAGALSKSQYAITKAIANKVRCDVDKVTGVITIDVTDQDPLICATIADSTCNRLQEFITEYRTKKARIEMENAQRQYDQAKEAYEVAKQRSKTFSDSNWDLVDDDLIVEKQALQNNMQMCFSNMSTFNQQLLAARAKYESLRPVYTVLDGASVPLKPMGSGRLKTVFVFLFLVLGSEAAWILFGADFWKKMKAAMKEPEDEPRSEGE